MEPQVNSSDPIPFHQLGSKPFERLCRHLLREQAKVKDSRIYGKNQQGQRGIDVLITLENDEECWAAQCKAYANYSKADFKTAIKNFRKHLTYWKKRGLSRFIVFVGCGLDDRFVQDELFNYEKEFEAHGIKIEIWDSDEIARQLKPFPSIVRTVFSSSTAHWLERICDVKEDLVAIGNANISDANARLQSVIDELGELRNAELDEVRELIREGSSIKAEQKFTAMETAVTWSDMPVKVRARALRMHASLVLNQRSDIEKARSLLNEADSLMGAKRSFFHTALLAFHESGAEDALAVLDRVETIDEWHLRAILLVNSARFGDALNLLNSGEFEENAETYRIRAIGNLYLRRLSSARSDIESALERSPSWVTVLEAAGKVYYYSSISSYSPDWGLWEAPAPVRWEFVKSDLESIEHLEKAENFFSQILASPHIDKRSASSVEFWKLACLANCRSKSKQQEARLLAQKIVDVSRLAAPAIVWALERNYELPVQEIRLLLEEIVNSTPDLGTVHTLLVLLIRTGKFTDAAALLDRFRKLYEDANNLNAWKFHRVQIAFVNEEIEVIDCLTRGDKELSLIVTSTEGAKEGWTDARLLTLSNACQETGSAATLYSACEAHHLAGRSGFVVEHAEELLAVLPSEKALMLSIYAAYSTGAFTDCIRFSNDYRQLFRNGAIPREIRRLRSWCFSNLGKHSDAALELRMLSSKDLNNFDKFNLFEAEYQSGDMRRTLQIAHDLVESEHATPDVLLHIISRTRADDPSLAQRAFEKINKLGISDPNLAARAYSESFHLGLEHEAKTFFETAAANMGEPGSPLIPFSLEEFQQHMEESRRAHQEHMNLYRRGEIPVHLLESAGNESLSHLGCLQPDWVRDSNSLLSSSWSYRIRHGSLRKSRVRSLEPPAGGVFVDTTSLLILQHFGLLSKLSEAIPVVRISPSTNSWIQKQIHELSGEQLSQKIAKQSVIDLIDHRLLEELTLSGNPSNHHGLEEFMGNVWCELLETAVVSNGYLIDTVPVLDNRLNGLIVELPSPVADRVMGNVQLCISAREAGFISLDKCQSCLEALGNKGSLELTPKPLDAETVLVLERGQAEHLAVIGLLEGLASSCRILILSQEIEKIRSELRYQKSREGLISELKRLRDHIRLKVDNSEFLEEATEEPVKSDRDGRFETDPLMRCVRDTLNPGRSGDVWTCIDDRRFSVQKRIGKSKVVGTYDILDFLHRSGHLTTQEHYGCLRQMRRRNFRFLETDSAEIVTLLNECFKSESSKAESVELATLRKYYSSVFLKADDLQRPHGNFRKARMATELRFLLRTAGAAAQAIFTIWSNGNDSATLRSIKSDWILDSLWFDSSASGEILSEFEVSPDLEVIGSQHLFFLAVRFAEKKGEVISLYLNWLFSRLTSRPARWIPVLLEVKKFLLNSIERLGQDGNRELNQYVVLKMHERIESALPQELIPYFAINIEDKQILGDTQFVKVGIGPFQFDASDLWRAAKDALSGNSATVSALESPPGFETVELVKNLTTTNPPALTLTSKTMNESFNWEQPVLMLLSESLPDAREPREALRKSMDVSREDFAEEVTKILSVEDLTERINQYSTHEAETLAKQLSLLSLKLERDKELDLALARPGELEALLRHIRIAPGGGSEGLLSALENAANLLIREEGFFEAFKRHSALPLKLSEPFIREFQKLSKKERERFRSFADRCDTIPLMAVHAATVLSCGNRSDIKVAVSLACRLMEPEKLSMFRFFQKILNWSFACLLNDRVGGVDFFDHCIAAWVHAGRIHQTIGSSSDHADIRKFFARNTPAIAGLSFVPEFAQFHNPINPNIFYPTALLLGAVSGISVTAKLTDSERADLGKVLKPICFPYVEFPDHPDVRIFQMACRSETPLELFWGSDVISNLTKLPGLDDLSKAGDVAVKGEIDRIVEELSQSPKRVDLWISLAGIWGINCPDGKHQRRLKELIATLSFSELEATSDMIASLGMFIFNLARFPSFQVPESIWTSLVANFGETILNPSFEASPKKVVQSCIFAAFSTSLIGFSSVYNANQKVADALRSMIASERKHPKELRQMVSNIAHMIPGRDSAPFWKLVLELREH